MNVIRVSALVLLITIVALVVKVWEVYALHVVEHVALAPGCLVPAQRTNVRSAAGLDIVVQALTGHTCNKKNMKSICKVFKNYHGTIQMSKVIVM